MRSTTTGWKPDRHNTGFPTSAVYISESGADRRVDTNYRSAVPHREQRTSRTTGAASFSGRTPTDSAAHRTTAVPATARWLTGTRPWKPAATPPLSRRASPTSPIAAGRHSSAGEGQSVQLQSRHRRKEVHGSRISAGITASSLSTAVIHRGALIRQDIVPDEHRVQARQPVLRQHLRRPLVLHGMARSAPRSAGASGGQPPA